MCLRPPSTADRPLGTATRRNRQTVKRALLIAGLFLANTTSTRCELISPNHTAYLLLDRNRAMRVRLHAKLFTLPTLPRKYPTYYKAEIKV